MNGVQLEATTVAGPTPTSGPILDRRWLDASLALTATVLTAVGFGGIGDAPDPHEPTGEITDWFTSRRADILLAAPFGYLGAMTIVALTAVLAGAHRRTVSTATSRALVAGGMVTAAYLVGAHVAWSANAYQIAAFSPEAAKAVFVLTFTSVPVFAAGMALMAGAAAASPSLMTFGRWWRVASAAVAATSSAGVVAFADHDYLSPDVQQQTIANLLLAWLVVTGLAAACTRAPSTFDPSPEPKEPMP